MSDLLATPYDTIYEALTEVREVFHREGRISDSNAKLDETIKVLAVHFAGQSGALEKSDYRALQERERFSVRLLDRAFAKVAAQEPFLLQDGQSIFGRQPKLGFEQDDAAVAFELFHAAGRAFSAQQQSDAPLDILNEAFGHHVRDNFRSHIEDAQYMTPPEVIDFMVSMASAVIRDQDFSGRKFVMADPSCGVGSFVAAWRKEFERGFVRCSKSLIALGQDKVDRMARLSAINLIFARNKFDKIFLGNSLFDGSPLDEYNGKVDLILTNPPFGAKFPRAMLSARGQRSVPFFAKAALTQSSIDSEFLFIDRYLTLLRPGGVCFAVVPDGVISAKGIAAVVRQHLAQSAKIIAVVELPSETFAQAGTRTKTAILAFQKIAGEGDASKKVFFGEALELGFEVSKRKGVPIKSESGRNQLPNVLAAFHSKVDSKENGILAVWRDVELLRADAWTPRRFALDGEALKTSTGTGQSKVLTLNDLVERAEGKRRRAIKYSESYYFISVLHVIGEGLLDVAGVKSYKPITPGLSVSAGEVIISRLNPRIPRVIVVPDLGRPLLCSSEFEILKPKPGVSPFALAYLLMSPIVQEQIQSLTAGTSASHSRVKSERLYEIRLPWPSGKSATSFSASLSEYESASKALVASMIKIASLRSGLAA